MTTPINRMIDAAMRCTKCDAPMEWLRLLGTLHVWMVRREGDAMRQSENDALLHEDEIRTERQEGVTAHDALRTTGTSADYDDYCGCCGRLIGKGGGIWCRQCAAHVLLAGAFERRTFGAQHKKPCPWRDRDA